MNVISDPKSNICFDRVIIDYRTSQDTIDELNRLGIDTFLTVRIDSLYEEVNGHADMQIHFVNNKAICAPESYDYYKTLNLSGYELISGSKHLKSKYPYDIAYNVCSIGKYVICRPLCTAMEILAEYQYLKKNILNTRQGYTKCSICVVDDNSAITADEGIYKLLKKNNINVLKIRDGFIDLYDMQGFIGGASGLVDNKLLFNGDIKTHPDYENINAFCKNSGVDIISLNKGNLTDIGSIIQF